MFGYNAYLIVFSATVLGASAGVCGTYLYMRKNSLLSDAISHSTLAGLAMAFLLVSALGGNGRSLVVLLVGSTLSATAGLAAVRYLVNNTRLGSDAAIGVVLSTFFALGVVMLSVIQILPIGQKAGLEGFLLGSTAGMLAQDAVLITVLSIILVVVFLVFRRDILVVSYDPIFAQTQGISLRRTDFIVMYGTLAVTVVGLSVVGLILIVALLIIPSAAARFWSNRVEIIVITAAVFGGLSGAVGASVSAFVEDAPVGSVIVLVSATIFVFSLVASPERGLVISLIRKAQSSWRVHLAMGLLSVAENRPIYEEKTRTILQKNGYLRPDGSVTATGQNAAMVALKNEQRWQVWTSQMQAEGTSVDPLGWMKIEHNLTPDQLRSIDRHLFRRDLSNA